MADSMCGPTNAFKGLANHLDRDRSLQQDRLQGGSPGPSQGFRSASANPAASNADFASFQNGGAPVQPFESQASHFAPHQVSRWQPNAPPHAGVASFQPPGLQHNVQNEWAQQFQHMSLNRAGPVNLQAHLAPLASQQGLQALPQMGQPSYQPMGQASHFGMPSYGAPAMFNQSMYHPAPQVNNFQSSFDQEIEDWMFDSVAAQDAAQNVNEQSTQALNDTQLDSKTDLDRTMDQLEGQAASLAVEGNQADLLSSPPLEETQAETEETVTENPTELARAAQDVLNAVSNNQTEKFKKSAFFELMDKIASGNKILQNNTFVDAQSATASQSESGFGSHITGARSGPNESAASVPRSAEADLGSAASA